LEDALSAIGTVFLVEIAAVAGLFCVLTFFDAWIPTFLSILILIGVWLVSVKVMLDRSRKSTRRVGVSFGLGTCVATSTLAVVMGVILGVAAYVNLGGQL
jgi:hypothetical protein